LGYTDQLYGRGAFMIAAVLWEIRALMGKEMADKNLLTAWSEFCRQPSDLYPPDFLKLYLVQIEKGDGQVRNFVDKGKQIYAKHNAPL
jgi:hypothetical protein